MGLRFHSDPRMAAAESNGRWPGQKRLTPRGDALNHSSKFFGGLALAGALLVAVGCGDDEPSSGATSARVVTVDIRNVVFKPRNLAIDVGTTVRWTNSDAEILHTVTKVSGAGEAFDSGNVYPGDTYERRFDEPGRIDYLCILHDGQTGSITVR